MLGADPVSDSANTIRLRDDHPAAKQQACRAEARYPIYSLLDQWLCPTILAVQFQQIEGAKSHRLVKAIAPQLIEVVHTLGEAHGLAVEHH